MYVRYSKVENSDEPAMNIRVAMVCAKSYIVHMDIIQ